MTRKLADLPRTAPESLPAGVWMNLLAHALRLVEVIDKHGINNPFWTFGGGTVLMLRYHHRVSKDIDIFVPDPAHQVLRLRHARPRQRICPLLL